MATNLGKIKVSRTYRKGSTPTLYSFAHGTAFGTTGIGATVPESDVTIYGYADTMMATHTSRQTNPSKTLTANEKAEKKTLLTALDLNADYLEGKANAKAISTGNINDGIAVVTAAGFLVAGRGLAHRVIGISKAGIGWILFQALKSKKGTEGFVYEFGPTPDKGTPPLNPKRASETSATCMFNNIPSKTVVAVRFASIVPPSHQAATNLPNTQRTVAAHATTPPVISKGKHPVIDFVNGQILTFSEWYYTVAP
ncbi:MAG: hypothetical protein ACYDCN_11235 [Bacteroidia bacterium]